MGNFNPIFRSRGFAAVHGKNYSANAAWFGTRCTIDSNAITVRVLGREHIHPKKDLVELRWIWLPFPGVVAISLTAEEYRYSAFQILRWSRLRSALQSCGYVFTEELRYCSVHRSRDDIRRYGLLDGVPI